MNCIYYSRSIKRCYGSAWINLKTLLHIIDTTGPGGAETVFVELASGLDPAKYRSIVLIRGPGWLKDQLDERGVEFYVADCKGSFNLGFLMFLRKLIRDEKVDLIHTHLLGSAVYGCLAAWLCRCPIVTTFHGNVDVSSQERFLRAKFGIINLFASQVVFVSEKLRANFMARVKLNQRKCTVILNGTKAPRLIGSKVESRKALGLPQDKVLLGALGNIRLAKAYPVFVEAVSILRQRGLDIHAAIAGQGDGPLLEQLQSVIAKHELQQHFSLLGFVKHTDTFLDAIDCYVISSSSEGHPLALTQAMMAGLPIVVTRCGVEEIVAADEDAIVIQKDDSLALADGVQKMLTHTDEAMVMGESARKKANASFGLEGMIHHYEQVYAAISNNAVLRDRVTSTS